MIVKTKRIYETYSPDDGFRVLADRLWARGITKEKAQLNLWAKEVTPSNDLRKWFHTHLDLYAEFKDKYLAELQANNEINNFLNEIKNHNRVTLLTAAKDIEHSHLPILENFIKQKLG